MSGRVPAVGRPVFRLSVVALTRIARRTTRLTVGGHGLAAFDRLPFTDSHVRILFPQPGVAYPDDFDMRRISAVLPRAQWPRTRTFTIRGDVPAGTLTIDIVHHSGAGLVAGWLAGLSRGDEVLLQGPGGGYRPERWARWHLLAGDHVALPAITAALEAMAPGTPARVFIEVTDADDEQRMPTRANLDLTWLHRARGHDLVRAVTEARLPAGPAQGFVHGEGGAMRLLRRHLVDERGFDRDRLSISGYWRRGLNDETWRAVKAAEAAYGPLPAAGRP